MQPTTRSPLRARTVVLRLTVAVALILMGAFALGPWAHADGEDDDPPAVVPVAPAAAPEGKDQEAFFDAAAPYFDLEEDLYVGRLAFKEALEAQQARGYDFLADLPFVRQTIYQCRYFYPQMDDKSWREDEGIDTYKSKGQQHHLKSEDIHLAFSLPKSYPTKNKTFLKRPRPMPVPLVVSTIQREDYTGQDFPGFHLIKRRFPKEISGDILSQWAVLVPIAPAGSYVDNDGRLLGQWLTYQMSRFFQQYHVDFDRIVLDGGPEVLLAGTSQPLLYAGFILRTPEKLSDEMKSLIPNFAHVPIFVVDCVETTKALQDAGHLNVSNGSAAEIPAWLKGVKRTPPKKFSWRLTGTQHQFAYWVNMEQVNWTAPDRTLEVEVVDTEDEPNTIKIDAVGVRELSLFLNDDIVDLSRKVRVIVNGHLEVDELIERDLDILFNRDPFKIRDSLYFGLLFPARKNRIVVRAPKEEEVPETPTVTEGSAEDEARAKQLLEQAKKYIEGGQPDGAKKRLEAIVKLGQTSVLSEAKELLAELNS